MESNKKGWERILFLIIPYFFIVGAFQSLGFIIAGIDLANFEVQKTTEQHLIIVLFGLIGSFLVLWVFMKFVDKEKFISLGFYLIKRKRDIVVGIVSGFLIMLTGLIILLLLNQVNISNINYNLKQTTLLVLVYLIVAITEEVLLRGYVLRNLIYSFNKYIALLISAILFSLMHAANPNITWIGFLNLFLAGVLLGLPYIYTKNLWFPIAFHFSWNFFQSLMGFNVSGKDSYSAISFTIIENNYINGGDFGFEGSILSVIFQVVLIFIMAYFFKRRDNLNKH